MIAFKVAWDGHSLAQFANFNLYDRYLQDLFDDLGDDYGAEGVRFIRPEVKGNGYWQPSTGETARGIDYEVTRSSNGFTVNFLGNNKASNGGNIANWIDVGNFPKNDVIMASDYGLKAFPISARAGQVDTFLAYIHGMGHTSNEYPKNFSEDGMRYLANETPRIAERALQSFLNDLVI